MKVPPLWKGPSPFEGRITSTVDSDTFSEAEEGMQWVNGKGWVAAEKTFLDSFDSALPQLRRSSSRPSTAPGLTLPPGEHYRKLCVPVSHPLHTGQLQENYWVLSFFYSRSS